MIQCLNQIRVRRSARAMSSTWLLSFPDDSPRLMNHSRPAPANLAGCILMQAEEGLPVV